MSKTLATRVWRVSNIKKALEETDLDALDRACERLGVGRSEVVEWHLVKRSIDARGRSAPSFVYQLDVTIPAASLDQSDDGQVRPAPAPAVRERKQVPEGSARPVVVGMGPCGLFAAMQLAEAGLRPVVIDRGKPVETRAKDVARLMGKGVIAPDSNLCFGEGGAGTWSDGKLYTRVGGPRVREVLDTLVAQGAPDRILVDGRPHLGTDKLVAILKAFRATLREMGCELRFETRVESFETDGSRITGVRVNGGEIIDASHVILAVGHSARDVYEYLVDAGVHLTPKPFAVGYRIEHPQRLIDTIQYGKWADHEALPAAYYELSARLDDQSQKRGVFSFCMCPGGSIVPTPTVEGEVCVNGMSHAARSGTYANSAVVVSIEPSDFASWARDDSEREATLAGVRFQEAAEHKAWDLGGGDFVAPAQRVVDFLERRASSEVRRTTYKRGVEAGDVRSCYPDRLMGFIDEALVRFDRRMPGYVSEDAVLIGVETRTSAPVTIVRDKDTLESVSHRGLFPAGEGAGYGGGIVSAAIDGLRVANRIVDSLLGSEAERDACD